MNFNKNKEELLKAFSQKKHDVIAERRSIEAKSRIKEKEKERELEKALNETIVEAKEDTPVPQDISDTVPASPVPDNVKEKNQKPSLALFGTKGLFITNLRSILQQYCEVYELNEIDKATEFLFENKTPIAVMDMDLPNNSKYCQDFFTTGKMVNPHMLCIAYQKDENLSEEAEFLKKQGAIIMQKPVNGILLAGLIKKFVTEWEEKNAAKQPD